MTALLFIYSGLLFFLIFEKIIKSSYINQMMDTSIFTRVDGSKKDKDLVFLGLSTCGFCKRARTFLEEEDYAYSYVDIDKLDREIRLRLKDDVKKRFTDDFLYPMLIIDDADYVKGFKKDIWLEKLN